LSRAEHESHLRYPNSWSLACAALIQNDENHDGPYAAALTFHSLPHALHRYFVSTAAGCPCPHNRPGTLNQRSTLLWPGSALKGMTILHACARDVRVYSYKKSYETRRKSLSFHLALP
jgi:hypothetical protein